MGQKGLSGLIHWKGNPTLPAAFLQRAFLKSLDQNDRTFATQTPLNGFLLPVLSFEQRSERATMQNSVQEILKRTLMSLIPRTLAQ
jgi:hypothetical protein